MIIYYDNRLDTIKFGVEILKMSLKNKRKLLIGQPLDKFVDIVKKNL